MIGLRWNVSHLPYFVAPGFSVQRMSARPEAGGKRYQVWVVRLWRTQISVAFGMRRDLSRRQVPHR